MLDDKTKEIIGLIKSNSPISSKAIHEILTSEMSYATVKRILTKLLAESLIQSTGKGKGTKYVIGQAYELLCPIDVTAYFENDLDDRDILGGYNLTLITDVLRHVSLFTKEELHKLTKLQKTYKDNISTLTASAYANELERLAIDFSWKSSQIEGNTYSLLETERLLKEKETAEGKQKDEATMLLNHKEALDFIISEPNYISPLKISRIEDIHSLLVNGLGIERNIRKRRIGISGTNYTPLDNDHQIKETLQDMCDLVNDRECVFEQALLLLILISYIQAFDDGNKRTARIISNAVLIKNGYCPISFRTINSVEYKKAMLIFYEKNNIIAFKKIFISQFEFAVKTYF
ncbi:MAG: cell filamentation protein Fic [Bacteroidetes bacterium]|nr:MAG: cell filamentation protein Fic [Bacteroidota bacterium]